MVIHIALYQWQDGAKESEINEVLAEVKNLQAKVPGLTAIYCGKNFSKWAKNFTHAIVVLAKSQEALDNYRAHPDHAAVAKKIEFMEKDGLGVDFES